MITVNDMYNEVKSNDEMLLSNYRATYWDDYRNNHDKYDKLFRRMFKSFKYFLQDDDESVEEVTTNFIDDVYNHLLIHDKRYSELYRINVIPDSDYSLTDNYNITETMDRDTTSVDTNTYGERVDSDSITEGARNDTSNTSDSSRQDSTTNVYGSQENNSTSKVAPYDSEEFANNTHTDDTIGGKTDTVTFDKGAETSNTTFGKGEQINSSTSTIGSHTDGLDNTSTEDYVLTRKGNIGVQTVTDMLDKHRKLWTMWDFYYFIFMEISKELLII